MSTPLRPNSIFAQLKPYEPPRAAAPVDLHLDGNEGISPEAGLLDEAATVGTEGMRRYPDARPLEGLLASSLAVEADQVLVTAGADDAIERLIRVFLGPTREMILPVPTFEMIPRYAELAGANVKEIPWLQGPLPVDAMIDALTPATTVITVVSPNSPNGLVATADDLIRLSSAAPGAVLMVDLAYGEFADDNLLPTVLSLPNAVALRSFSKAWGMAGLRVGWAAGPARVISWMRAAGHPYAVSSLSLALAFRRFQSGRADVDRFVRRVRRQRAELEALTPSLAGETVPSQGNFQLIRFRDAQWVRDGLAGLGISVRILPGKAHLQNCLRITVPGDDDQWARLRHGLVTVLKPEVLVLPWQLTENPEHLDQQAVDTLARISDRVTIVWACQDGPDSALDAISKLSAPRWTMESGSDRTGHSIPILDSIREVTNAKALWAVATTEKQVKAARKAKILPLGLTGPTDDAAHSDRLISAGAGRVLSHLRDIEELMP